MIVGACSRVILNEGEDVIGEDKNRSWGVRLVGTGEAVVVAVGST